MATLTEQYTELVQQSQEAVRTAVDNWTKTVQQAMGQLPATAVPFDASQVSPSPRCCTPRGRGRSR